jgi:hypothetical protein
LILHLPAYTYSLYTVGETERNQPGEWNRGPNP